MKTDNSIPPEKVFGKASLLLERLVKVLDYQSDRFDAESVEEFSDNQQETFSRISAMLSDASSACGRALDQIERVRGLLQ
jgi:hypothetical protein